MPHEPQPEPTNRDHINARVNFEMRDDGLYVCFGLHERSEGCRWQRVDELMVRDLMAQRDDARADLQRLRESIANPAR